MSLNQDQIDILADKYIISLYKNLERDVIGDIVRRVKKCERWTETAEIEAKHLRELGYSPKEIQAKVLQMLRADKEFQDFIAQNTLEHKKYVMDCIRQTERDAKKAGDKMVAEAGSMSFNDDLSMWEEAGKDLTKPNNMTQMVNAFQKQTNQELRNLTRTMGFKGTTLENVSTAFQKELDQCVVKVASGSFSFDAALKDCIRTLSKSGLRTIDYASGRTYQIDTASRMCVRTCISQLSGRITEANIESTGVDLVITSQHIGARPEHEVWENQVFAYKGKSKKYPDFVESTGYGTVTGLKGANCTHEFYPYWEGISVIPDKKVEPDPVEVDGKTYTYYEATQEQRRMERSIRADKRERDALNSIGEDSSEVRNRISKKINDYHRFSQEVGIRAKDNRL